MYSLITFNGQGIKGNRRRWMEDILPRDTVEKYVIGLIFFPTENRPNTQCMDRKLQKQVGVILFYL